MGSPSDSPRSAFTASHAVAYHEAGHAVAAEHLGGSVEFVTIEATTRLRVGMTIDELAEFEAEPLGGLTRIDLMWIRPPWVEHAFGAWHGLRALRLYAYAGPAAGLAYDVLQGDDDYGDDSEMIFEDGQGRNDHEVLVEQAEQYGLAAFFTEPDLDAFDRARRFVRWQWRAIEAVARALIERTTLSGDEVREIIQKTREER